MKKYILCVHGIGKHSENWTDTPDDGKSFKQTLTDIWGEYADSKNRSSFDAAVEIIPIHYDEEIIRIFNYWVNNVDKIKAEMQAAPLVLDQIDWFIDAVDAASSANTNDDFRFTHLMDLILFAGIQSIQNRLIVYVGKQIADAIQKITSIEPRAEISIVAHSMGTSMVHKVLPYLFSETVKTPFGSQTLQGNFKFSCITMIANCSYALSRKSKTFYTGVVRPSISAGVGCCTKWINVGHRFDPVARFLPFDPYENPEWLERFIAAKGWHRNITLNGISSRNIHSINHYFRDPEFHVPFFDLVFNVDVTDAELKKAVDSYQQSTIQLQLKGLEAQFEKIDVKDISSFKEFIVSLKSFLAIAKGF